MNLELMHGKNQLKIHETEKKGLLNQRNSAFNQLLF